MSIYFDFILHIVIDNNKSMDERYYQLYGAVIIINKKKMYFFLSVP
jgi:hypothetical protein